MPLLQKIRTFFASPEGKRLADQGRRLAADPRNRERAHRLLGRLRKR
jgi:hypothetical protein